MWKQFSWFFPNYWKKSGAFTGYISSPNLFCKECVENIKENWNVYNVKDLKMWSVTRIIYALSSVVVAEFSFYWCIRTWLCYVLQAVLLLQNECQKLSSLKITLSLRSREMNKRSKGGLAARIDCYEQSHPRKTSGFLFLKMCAITCESQAFVAI